jgi:type III secretory pathway component EscV
LSGSRSEGPQILLAPMDVRRYLKKILAARLPSLVVLSYQELPSHVQIQTAGTLGLLSTPHRRLA